MRNKFEQTPIWFSSLGLSFSILVISLLLMIILNNGFRAFWAKKIALVETSSNQHPLIAGQIVKNSEQEIQIFTGNKDAQGFSFQYLPISEIKKITYPKNYVQAHRYTYGDAIFIPIELQIGKSKKINATANHFQKELKKHFSIQKERRKLALKERKEIGKINDKIAKNADKIEKYQYLEKKKGKNLQEKKANLETTIQKLTKEYLLIQANLEKMEEKQDTFLVYQISTGEIRKQALSEIDSYHYINQLGLFGKIKLLLNRIFHFIIEEPREANTEGGIFPAIFGTFVMTVIMSIAVTPLGVIGALYLKEYTKNGYIVRFIRVCINNLAGIPSIVFGVFGLGFFIYTFGGGLDAFLYPWRNNQPVWGTGGILWASLTLALMTLPVVIVATEEALNAVPQGIKEAAIACGCSKWQMIQRIVLPASAPGILTGMILAMARGAGEVAPLMLVGVVKLAPSLPIGAEFPFGLDKKFMHLGFHIYDLGFQSPDSEAAKPMVFATILVLIFLIILLNLGAILLRSHLRKKYQSSAF